MESAQIEDRLAAMEQMLQTKRDELAKVESDLQADLQRRIDLGKRHRHRLERDIGVLTSDIESMKEALRAMSRKMIS